MAEGGGGGGDNNQTDDCGHLREEEDSEGYM